MTVLVASTVAPYKCAVEDPMEYLAWLQHADAWKERGHEFFLALELGHAGATDPRFDRMLPAFAAVSGTLWTFSIDDFERTLTSGGRLVRICTGRNLAHELFNRNPGRWEGILFLDTDTEPPEDAPERLLEVDHELVGFEVPTYCMDGPKVVQFEDGDHWRAYYEDPKLRRSTLGQGPTSWTQPGPFFPEGADVRVHWNTAGALLVREHAARHLRWRYDLSRGQTDDPCFQEDAVQRGYGQTWVRHDVVGQHHPGTIQPLENRGHDLSL